MNFYKTLPTVKGLRDYIIKNYDTYLEQLRTSSEEYDLPCINSVEIGTDYTSKGRSKPFILIDPASMNPEDDMPGHIEAVMAVDVLIAVDGYTDTSASEKAMLYADAFLSMVWADQYLGCLVIHATPTQVDYFPGGTGNVKYILINLLLTVEESRS